MEDGRPGPEALRTIQVKIFTAKVAKNSAKDAKATEWLQRTVAGKSRLTVGPRWWSTFARAG